MEAWRFLHTGDRSPAENMAIDEAILTAHSEEKSPPTVRFYGWNPATLSIGYFQKAQEVDMEAVESEGIGFVRRPTGGRAVLHDRELTYSIIVSETYPGIPRNVTDAYRVLSEGLLQGFRGLGLNAEMVQLASEEEKEKYASVAGSSACFDSPSWYELVVEGRKIAGSAQVRQKDVVLQHGSILLDMDTDQLFRLLKFSNEKVAERMKQSFAKKAVTINDLLRAQNKPPIHLREVEEAFRRGIAKGLGIVLEDGELTAFEQELTRQLVQEKYTAENWNFRR